MTPTIEDVLKKHIDEYNSTVNDMHKFKLSERELKMFAAAMTEYASLNRQGWTRVQTELPEESEWVLAYCKEDREHFERCCVAKVVDKEWFEYDGNHKNEPSVTHWMPLPNKPSI